MKRTAYTFAVVRYVHDAAAGETLNVGVLLYSPAARHACLRLETRYRRLSDAFRNFDGDQYRAALRRLVGEVDRWARKLSGELDLESPPADAAALGARIWPDPDASFRFGPALAGVAADLDTAAADLFTRMVESQAPEIRDERRTDEQVWAGIYEKPLARSRIVPILRPHNVGSRSAAAEIKFDHAFKNEKWHALRPLSFDLVSPETMQRKAVQWIGYGTVLDEAPDFATVYFLLGPPESRRQRVAYEKSKALLHRTPVKHEIVEEDAADDFARELERRLEKHGVLGKLS